MRFGVLTTFKINWLKSSYHLYVANHLFFLSIAIIILQMPIVTWKTPVI